MPRKLAIYLFYIYDSCILNEVAILRLQSRGEFELF